MRLSPGASLAVCLSLASAASNAAAQAAPAPATTASPTPAVRFTGYIQTRETYRDGVGLTGSINRARLTA